VKRIAREANSAGRTIEPSGRIYLAGPFTSQTRPHDGHGDRQVIDGTSGWRSALLAAETALRRLGWAVFLPHRDVSAWGIRQTTPETVARECIDALLGSDVVVALLGESFGTHVEVASRSAGVSRPSSSGPANCPSRTSAAASPARR